MTPNRQTQDGTRTYSYDADGNLAAVDGGSTAKYTYDALNRRVRADAGGVSAEFRFHPDGRRAGVWDGGTLQPTRGQYYWGAAPVAYYTSRTHFQHQDWLGTARLQTGYNGAVEATYTSLPFGDGSSDADAAAQFYGNGSAQDDAYHFAALDHDAETNTDHATYRNYSPTQGRWLTPDPYDGSYDITNPQSLNRYAYVLNNPLGFTDQLGLECDSDDDDDNGCGDGGGSMDGGGGGVDGDGGGGYVGAGAGGYAPGTILQDQNGNYYVVNADGSVTPIAPPQSVSVNGGGCQLSDPVCALWLSTLISSSTQGLCTPPLVCQAPPTGPARAPNKPQQPKVTAQQQHQLLCNTLDNVAKGAAVAGDLSFTVAAGAGVITGIAALNLEAAPVSAPVAAGAGVVAVVTGGAGVLFKGVQYSYGAIANWGFGCGNSW